MCVISTVQWYLLYSSGFEYGLNPQVCLFVFLGHNCCALDIVVPNLLFSFLLFVACFPLIISHPISVCWVFSVVSSLKILQTFWGNMGNFRLLMIWIKHIQEIYNFKEFADISFSFPPYLPPPHPKFENRARWWSRPWGAKPKGPWPSQRLGAVLRNLLWPQHYTTTLGRFFFANFGDAGFRNLFLFFADRDSCRWFGLAETLKTTSRQLFNVRAGWRFSAAARIILMSNVNPPMIISNSK